MSSLVRAYVAVLITVCGLIFSIRFSMLKARLVSLVGHQLTLQGEPTTGALAINFGLDVTSSLQILMLSFCLSQGSKCSPLGAAHFEVPEGSGSFR